MFVLFTTATHEVGRIGFTDHYMLGTYLLTAIFNDLVTASVSGWILTIIYSTDNTLEVSS